MKAKTWFDLVRSVLIYIAVYLLLGVLLAFTPLGSAGGGMYLSAVVMAAGGIAVFLTIKKGEFEFLSKEKAAPFWFMALTVLILSLGTAVFLNRMMEYVPWELFPGKHVEQDNETLFGIPVFWQIFIYVVIAPLSEEVLFRGAIFARLRKVIPVWAAIFLSAAVFGIYHLNWMQGIYAFLMGSIMAALFERFDSFLATLMFHMLANLWVILAMILPKWNEFLSTPLGLILSVILSLMGIFLVLFKKQNICSKK